MEGVIVDIYDLEQTLAQLNGSFPYTLTPHSLADLCRQDIITPLYPYNLWYEVPIDYEDKYFPIYATGAIYRCRGYLTDFRMIDLLDGTRMELKTARATLYCDYGVPSHKMVEDAVLYDWPYNYRADMNGEYKPAEVTIRLNHLRFDRQQVDNYIAMQSFDKLTDPTHELERLQEVLAQKEQEISELKAQRHAQPLAGLEKYNAEKANTIATAQAIANYLWSMDRDQQIRTGDMADQIKSLLLDIAPKHLPEKDDTVKSWLADIAPDYAKSGGRPPKNAPTEIPLIMKK